MTRDEIYKEMNDVFGQVPVAYQMIPEEYLPSFWQSWKEGFQQDDTIPGKYRNLIGLAISAAFADQYDVAFFTELAKMDGATEDEIQHVAYMVKNIAGWKEFLQANQVNLEQFKHQLTQMVQYMKDRRGMRPEVEGVKPSM